MNEWNRIPIAWLSDASPKARGQELVAFRWTGCLCLQTRVRLNELNRKSSWVYAQISVHFAEMSIWFGNILLTEWTWMCALDHWWFIFIHIPFVPIQSWILWPEVTAEHREFHEIQWHNRYVYSLAMNYTCALLQGRRRQLEGRDKIVIHRTVSANQATQYIGNWAWTFRWVPGSSDYFPSHTKP